MAFEAEGWKEIGEVYKDSLDFVLANSKAFSAEAQAEIHRFLWSFVMIQKPYMLATQKGVQLAVATVFTSEIIRDFVLTLVYVFFSRWGGTSQRFSELTESLAFAVGASGFPGAGRGQNAIPKQILEDLPREDLVLPVLQENKWLVVLLLMQLVVAVPALPESKPKKQQQQS